MKNISVKFALSAQLSGPGLFEVGSSVDICEWLRAAFRLPIRQSLGMIVCLCWAMAAFANQPTKLSLSEVEREAGFELLFDGYSLEGWEGDLHYFRVQDHAIVAGNLVNKIPHNQFLCTKRQFADFELRLEAKLVGQGDNAGVQFRSHRVANSHEVSGYQCDIGMMNQKQSIWGALYDESRRNRFLVESPKDSIQAIQQQDWNQLRILAVDSTVQIFVNDQLMADYRETDSQIPGSGVIGLQIHSGPPSEAWYRQIRIRSLEQR